MTHPQYQARRVPVAAGQIRPWSGRRRGARFVGPSSGENCRTCFQETTGSYPLRKARPGLPGHPFFVRLGDRFPGLFKQLAWLCRAEVLR